MTVRDGLAFPDYFTAWRDAPLPTRPEQAGEGVRPGDPRFADGGTRRVRGTQGGSRDHSCGRCVVDHLTPQGHFAKSSADRKSLLLRRHICMCAAVRVVTTVSIWGPHRCRARRAPGRGPETKVPCPPRPLPCGNLDDDDYPAYTMGRAADILGITPAFLRAVGEAELITPLRSEGGHRRYSKGQLRIAARARELVDQGTPVEAACRIIALEDRLAEALRLNGQMCRRPDE